MEVSINHMTQKIIFGALIFFGCTTNALAHVPVLVHPQSVADITQITDPELSQAFYGAMTGFPHTFEIHADTPFTLKTEILVPDIDEGKNIISGIIIKENPEGGRVIEIVRLNAKEALWKSQFEPYGGDSYRHGPLFEKQLDAGTYRVEVHTPDNIEKYVLVVGSREEMTLGYFELLKRLIAVKEFFGKSPIMVIESLYVYVPVIVCGIIGLTLWYIRKRKSQKYPIVK